MKRAFPSVGAGLLAAALAPVCLAQVPGQPGGASTQAPKTALVAGRVVDHSGAGVANAVVWLRTPPPPNAPPPRGPQGDRVATNADGRFAFSGLAAGAYQIDASKPGWLTGAYGRRRPGGNSSSLEVAEGERRNDLTITVWRNAVIGGRVVDDRGDPLIGAEIRAIRQTYIAGRPQGDTPIRVRTDDRGVYRFADLLPGDYIVAVLMNVTSEPATLAGAIRTGGETPRAYLQTMSSIGAMPMVFDRATSVTGVDQPLIRTLSESVGRSDAGPADAGLCHDLLSLVVEHQDGEARQGSVGRATGSDRLHDALAADLAGVGRRSRRRRCGRVACRASGSCRRR